MLRLREKKLTAALAIGLTAAFLAPSEGSAQQTNSPIPHEFFVYSENELGGGDSDLPDLPQPGLAVEATPGGDAPLVFTADGPQFGGPLDDPNLGGQQNAPPSSSAPVRLDRDTDREGMLRYAAVYEPSVTPFKRMGARDWVQLQQSDYQIGLRDDRLRPIPIGGSPDAGTDLFVGRMSIRASGGRAIPLPSVAPNMQIHQVATSPPVSVEVLADGADNFYLRSDADGDVDIEWTVSAPRSYFGGPIDDTGERSRPGTLAAQHRRDAEFVIDEIGLRSGMSDAERVEVMVAYFRAFEAVPFPAEVQSDNLYLDISLMQLGVCRHRAQAFVITAAALGMDARYVYNEAHAFVEVDIAGHGWRRIDLGGAAAGLEVYGEDEPEPHDPGDDPWGYEGTLSDEVGEPQPQTYSSGGGNGSGSGSSSRSGEEQGTDNGTTAEMTEDPNAPASADADETTAQGSGDETVDEGAMPEPRRFADLPPGPDDNVASGDEAPPTDEMPLVRMRTSLSFAVEEDRVYRGETVTVSGRLIDAEGQTAGPADITLYLGPADESRADDPVMRLGSARANDEGWFEAEIDIPATTPVGSWGIYAVFAGGPGYEPSRSD